MDRKPNNWASLWRQSPTPAQIKILDCLAERIPRQDVHKKLGIAATTVTTQLSRICNLFGVENWREALAIYQHTDYRPSVIDKLDRAETLLRTVLLHPATNNTMAQPKLLQCLDALARARRILKAQKSP